MNPNYFLRKYADLIRGLRSPEPKYRVTKAGARPWVHSDHTLRRAIDEAAHGFVPQVIFTPVGSQLDRLLQGQEPELARRLGLEPLDG